MNSSTEITQRQLEILQHSRGTDQYGRGNRYRNHYCAGGNDIDDCNQLVLAGLMWKMNLSSDLTGDCVAFSVTHAGDYCITSRSPKPPKISRSKQRYRDWLKADSSLTFGEWLKARAHG